MSMYEICDFDIFKCRLKSSYGGRTNIPKGRGLSCKGVSPLIATVLLIAFAIAAAGILANFVLPFTQSTVSESTSRGSSDISCSYANIIIDEASWNSTSNTLSLTIENNGRETLKNFKASIVRTNNTVSTLILAPTGAEMQPGDIETFTNATNVAPCSDISSVTVRSDTCPTDARHEIQKASITSC
ncbi:MAG: hypothetical protein HYS81_02710 [Candidatus Aenigmatarchaeota archaeon]|nr:MAG: hypothetical protein HYS81_02710 [Candidatus Aenigmarchaeota archaeon]